MNSDKILYDNLSAEERASLNLNDILLVDRLELSFRSKAVGALKAVLFSAVAIFVFFVNVTVNGKSDVPFGHIYNYFISALGNAGLWGITIVIALNGILSVYGKFFAPEGSRLRRYYGGESFVYPVFYLMGGVFTLIYTMDATIPGFAGPEFIVSSATGGTAVPAIVVGVAWIIPVSCVFLPFLLNYGLVDMVGTLMEPLMRPVFKVPGYAAVNCIASFVSSSSVGVLITNRQYRKGLYTEKEADLIATGFSAVSVGFAYMVIKTAGLGDYFLRVYFCSLVITLMISAVICRLPPLRNKRGVYADGRAQTEEEILAQRGTGNLLVKGFERAEKKAYTAGKLLPEIRDSVLDAMTVYPKVLTLLAGVGILGLIVATYTPVFQWIGKIFIPILKLCAVPDAEVIAPSLPVGIAEMFLPVMLIADKVSELSIKARYMVTTVSICQIIFFSETIVVMLASKLPLKLSDLVICFFERTFIAIPITAAFMHLMF
ncbi:YjiH family protein [Pyramidobacter piscolens]|uniref:YjiH family protein n=1 Tax=Pyramidobacter piscolens TaxID=638849 RepID=UPI003AB699E5